MQPRWPRNPPRRRQICRSVQSLPGAGLIWSGDGLRSGRGGGRDPGHVLFLWGLEEEDWWEGKTRARKQGPQEGKEVGCPTPGAQERRA